MEGSGSYGDLNLAQWSADDGGTPNVSRVGGQVDSYDCPHSFFIVFCRRVHQKEIPLKAALSAKTLGYDKNRIL